MKKPTQFWFINCEPKQNIVFESLDYVEQRKCDYITKGNTGKDRQVARSEIHPQYANRFIRQYLIEPQERSDKDADKKCTYKETGCGSCKRQLDCPIEADTSESEDRCKNCEYYRNPDYTRCHECKAESEDKE